MGKLYTWFYIVGAVLVAVTANSISTIWAGKENKLTSIWFLAVILISPFVFIAFGLVTSRLGLTVSSATVDSLLTISSVLVGLFFFQEWGTLSYHQYLGLTLAILGIIFMQFPK